MRLVVQRVKEASVEINNTLHSKIGQGLLLLLGVDPNDTDEDINWLANKVAQMRIFSDAEGLMNKSVIDVNGEVMVVSQFTLFASTKKGNRPSFTGAAKPDLAKELYLNFVNVLTKQIQKQVATGLFAADMQVKLVNDGPVTILIDSKNKE